MSGWPSHGPDDDRRLALAIQAGEQDALGRALDAYAPRLYDYCHALLRDQETAARALHDALLAAHSHIGGLTEPEYFRGWLYALARNECMRRLHDPNRPPGRHEAPEVEDSFLSPEEQVRRQEARQLAHSALAGLGGRQRETIDLLFRHGLDPQEVGGILGLDQQEADELARRSRHDLAEALAAATVARAGAASPCPSVTALTGDGRWPLAPATCRKLIRHVGTCPICSDQRGNAPAPGPLLQVLPVAMMPMELRARVLTAAVAPELAEARSRIARRAEPFDQWGWPVPINPKADRPAATAGKERGSRSMLWPVAAAAVAVFLLVGGVFFVLSGSPDETASGGASPGAAAPDPSEPLDPSADPSELPTPSDTPTPTPTPTPSATRTTASPTPRQSAPRPRVSVVGCSIPAGDVRCTARVVVTGGSVMWTLRASGVVVFGRTSGTSSASVTVVRPGSGCSTGAGGSGTITVSPGGSARIGWTCPPPGSGTPDPPGPGGGG